MYVKMINDKVLIRPDEVEKITKSGIIIPDVATEKPEIGVVVSVGEGLYKGGNKIPLGVKEGDKILFSSYSGTEITIEGETLIMVREHDIFGVFE